MHLKAQLYFRSKETKKTRQKTYLNCISILIRSLVDHWLSNWRITLNHHKR